jgi:hypothetical protein
MSALLGLFASQNPVPIHTVASNPTKMAGIVVAAVLLFYVLSVWAFISRSPVRLPPAGSRWPILNRLESLTKGKAILYRVYQKVCI